MKDFCLNVLRVIVAAALCGSSAAQPVADIGTGVADLEARLTSLDPSRPLEYFLLAEEVASEIRTAEGRSLARRLAALSYALSVESGASRASPLARSVCVFLLEEGLIEDEGDRRYVAALRDALSDATMREAAPSEARQTETDPTGTALALATALGEYRAGRFREAQALFERDDVRSLLARHAATLRGVGVMLRDVESRPSCRECRNRRIVRDEVNPDADRRLCRTCGGDPSPALAPVDLISSLRTEALLLGGKDASWSARIAAGRVEPFVDVDPARLAERLGVD
ncbi:MAG: hypothetical protein ACTS27_11005, partial [Phycisphaerales bacterium]